MAGDRTQRTLGFLKVAKVARSRAAAGAVPPGFPPARERYNSGIPTPEAKLGRARGGCVGVVGSLVKGFAID
jgi:hypothetical protein